MANDHKPVKYLRYAIGEIFLVVIGILIALQVNNWNENRKSAKESKIFLNRLTEDLLTENTVLQERADYYALVQTHAKKIVKMLSSPPDSLDEQFVISAYQASQQWMYRNVRDTYDELISTGNIKLIPDEGLRKRIGMYYDETDVYMRIWYDQTDYRELARSCIPYDVQKKIQQACEIWTDMDQQIGGNELIENCSPDLSKEEIEKSLTQLKYNNQLNNGTFLLAANRQVADIELKLGLYKRKLNGNKKLLELMNQKQAK